MAGTGHGFSILQWSSRSCSSPACCQELGSHPRIRGWSRESHGAAGAGAGTATSGRSCVTVQAPAHPAPSQKAPLPGSSPQHMVNTLLIIMAVNSTSLLPEPPAGTGTWLLPARCHQHTQGCSAPLSPAWGVLSFRAPSTARTPVWHLPTAHCVLAQVRHCLG